MPIILNTARPLPPPVYEPYTSVFSSIFIASDVILFSAVFLVKYKMAFGMVL